MRVVSRNRWKKIINQQLTALGLHEAYNSTIESLAAILEQRDKTYLEFQESGGKSVIEYTNKGGSTNMTKNPLLVMWDELNKTALAYWREMGLTPAAYKKLTGEERRKGERTGGGSCIHRMLKTGQRSWSMRKASATEERLPA